MAMQYDVKAATATTNSTVVSYRVRVKGLVVSPDGSAGSVVVKDGGSGGTVILTVPTTASTNPFPVVIPGEGILCATSVYVDVGGNDGVVVFYG